MCWIIKFGEKKLTTTITALKIYLRYCNKKKKKIVDARRKSRTYYTNLWLKGFPSCPEVKIKIKIEREIHAFRPQVPS